MFETIVKQLSANSLELHSLDLTKDPLNLFQIAELSDALADSKHLTSLKILILDENSLDIICDTLINGYQKIPEVILYLSFSNTNISERSVAVLVNAIKNDSVTSVVIQDCQLTKENIENLLPAIAENFGFQQLNFKGSFIAPAPIDNTPTSRLQNNIEQLLFALSDLPNDIGLTKALPIPDGTILLPLIFMQKSGIYAKFSIGKELHCAQIKANNFAWLEQPLAPSNCFPPLAQILLWLSDKEVMSYDKKQFKLWKNDNGKWQSVTQRNALQVYFVNYWNGQLQIAHYGWENEEQFRRGDIPNYRLEIWERQANNDNWQVISNSIFRKTKKHYSEEQLIPLLNGGATLISALNTPNHKGIVGVHVPVAISNYQAIGKLGNTDKIYVYNCATKKTEQQISNWCVIPLWNNGLICAFNRQYSTNQWQLSVTLWQLTSKGELQPIQNYPLLPITLQDPADQIEEPILLPDYSIVLQTSHMLVILTIPELKSLSNNKFFEQIPTTEQLSENAKSEKIDLELQFFRAPGKTRLHTKNIISSKTSTLPQNISVPIIDTQPMTKGMTEIPIGNLSPHHPLTSAKLRHSSSPFLFHKELKKSTGGDKIFSKDTVHVQGLIYVEIPPDGNCLFNAVALYLQASQDKIRDITTSHLENNLEIFRNFIALPSGMTMKNYFHNLRHGREWASNVEINALMRILNRPIAVIGPDGALRNRDEVQQYDGEPIFVYFNGINHYDALLLREETNSREILLNLLSAASNNLQATAMVC